MSFYNLLSPLDNRYYLKVKELNEYFSDSAFVQTRAKIEVKYLEFIVKEIEQKDVKKECDLIFNQITEDSLQRIYELEKITNHDVKAIEYYLREQTSKLNITDLDTYIHYGLTSQDVNSLAISINLKTGTEKIILPILKQILTSIKDKANIYNKTIMCGHTHGQISSPTIVGKELLVFVERLNKEINTLENLSKKITCKFGGATGNFSTHYYTYPNINWKEKLTNWITQNFDIVLSEYTTQIDNYESYAELFDCYCRINRICIDFSRDMWLYGLKKYIKMEKKDGEIGSSTMPHKINPIQFEHTEGILGLANSMGHFFSDKLPQSRLQRDLTDSVVLRFLGEFIGMNLDGYKSLLDGISRLQFNIDNINKDIDLYYCDLISEGIQMILRKHKVKDAYEKVKDFMRGKQINKIEYEKWVKENFQNIIQIELLNLNPNSYLNIN